LHKGIGVEICRPQQAQQRSTDTEGGLDIKSYDRGTEAMKKDQNIAQKDKKADEIAVGYDLPSFPKPD